MNLNLNLPEYSSLNLNNYLLLSTVETSESLVESCLLWLNHQLMLSTVEISESLVESCLLFLNQCCLQLQSLNLWSNLVCSD